MTNKYQQVFKYTKTCKINVSINNPQKLYFQTLNNQQAKDIKSIKRQLAHKFDNLIIC